MIATALTAAFASVGGAPLRTFRQSSGPTIFWLMNGLVMALLFGTGLQLLAISYLGIVLAVGLFTELEDAGLNTAQAALGSLGLVFILASAGFAFWIGSLPGVWQAELMGVVNPYYEQLMELRPGLDITAEALLYQLPGAIFVMLMASMYFSLIGEKLFSRWLGVGLHSQKNLVKFKLPDELVWLFIGSVFAAFYDHGYLAVKYVGANLFLVTLGAYFFQGLAVVTHFFNRIKLGKGWRVLAYLVLVIQLMLLVSLIGVADMWLEFRSHKTDKRSGEKIKV